MLLDVAGGGIAPLLGGDPALAFRVGFVPFLTGDLLKIGLAAAVILAAGSRFRAAPHPSSSRSTEKSR